MFAAIDLGSNSFRLHIGRFEKGTMRVVKSARDPIRLGAGLDQKGNLTEQAMQNAIDSLRGFNVLLNDYPLVAVRAVATNTLRIAKNVHAFLPAAEKALGYPIQIISGEEEGRLIYAGVSHLLGVTGGAADEKPGEKRLVLDIGGGSTELILGCGQEIVRVESFGIGAVRQSLSFFPEGNLNAASFEAAILSARNHFEEAASLYHPQFWTNAYGSSGTIRALADAIVKNKLGNSNDNDNDNGNGGGILTLENLEALKQRLIQFGHASRIDLAGMKRDRAATIMGGLAVLIGLMQELDIERLIPIDAGLRMGILWDLLYS